MDKLKLKQIQIALYHMQDAWVKRGNKLTRYTCQHCKMSLPTKQPNAVMVQAKGYWDSAMICANCGGFNFLCVWPNGKTKAVKI